MYKVPRLTEERKKLLPLCYDMMKRLAGRGEEMNSVGNYGIVFESGKTKDLPGNPCFGNLNYVVKTYDEKPDWEHKHNKMQPLDDKALFFVDVSCVLINKFIHGPKRKNSDSPHWKKEQKLVAWTLNESMFKDVFITKDPVEAVEQGVICHTHMPINFIVPACMTYRELYKDVDKILVTDLLIEGGIEPNTAHLMSHFFRRRSSGGWSVSFLNGGHSIISPSSLTMKGFSQFISGDLSIFDRYKPMRDQFWGYNDLTLVWNKGHSRKDTFRDNLMKFPNWPGKKSERDAWGTVLPPYYTDEELPEYCRFLIKENTVDLEKK